MSIQDLTINPKLRFFCQKVLPLVYDNSLSYYETICKIASAVNMLTDDVNELISYVQNLDKEIDSKILDILNKYVESAEFISLVNATINNLFTPFKNELLAEWETYKTDIGNLIDDKFSTVVNKEQPIATDLDTRRLAREISKDNSFYTDKQYFSNAQSIVFYKGNYVVGFNSSGEYSTSPTALLKKYDESFNLITSTEVSAYHVNDLTYSEYTNKLYCCTLNLVNEASYGLAILDCDTLQIVGNIPLEFNPVSVCCDGKNLYLQNASNKSIIKYSLETNAIVGTFLLNYDFPIGIYAQTMEYYNGYLYLTYVYPSIILCFDLAGNHKFTYNIPKYIQNAYNLAEIEGICATGDGFFTLCGAYNHEPSHMTRVTQYFEINVYTNVVNSVASTIQTSATSDTLNVDTSSTSNNPDGKTYPFKYLFEAIDISKSPMYRDRDVVVNATGTDEFTSVIENLNSFTLRGNNFNLSGLTIIRCGHVYLGGNGLVINGRNGLTNSLLVNYVSNLFLNCTINKNESTNAATFNNVTIFVGPSAICSNAITNNCEILQSYAQNNFVPVFNNSGTVYTKNILLYTGSSYNQVVNMSKNSALFKKIGIKIKCSSDSYYLEIPVLANIGPSTIYMLHKGDSENIVITATCAITNEECSLTLFAKTMMDESVSIPTDIYIEKIIGIF